MALIYSIYYFGSGIMIIHTHVCEGERENYGRSYFLIIDSEFVVKASVLATLDT